LPEVPVDHAKAFVETVKTILMSFTDRWVGYIHGLQDRICTAVEAADGKSLF
jgi:hypothetical protein